MKKAARLVFYSILRNTAQPGRTSGTVSYLNRAGSKRVYLTNNTELAG